MNVPSSYWNKTPVYFAWIQALNNWIDPDSPEYLSPEKRVAVFDLDGTIWCEKPYFAEIFFVIDKLKAALQEDLTKEVRSQVLDAVAMAENRFVGSGMMLIDAFNLVYSDYSNKQLEMMSGEWLDRAQHRDFSCSYLELAYLPMKEWIDALHAQQFSCYVCTGSSEPFVRPWIEAVFGIHADKVLGSELYGNDGNQPIVLNINEEKICSVKSRCPVDPVLVVGNSDGDLELLEWALTNNLSAQCYVVDHDDPEREYQYPLSDTIEHWLAQDSTQLTRISMKEDWSRVFTSNHKKV
ncbi:haloacid dehalogenase-like hydrolase [Vibrio sp. S9_S30]|uniref:haloacid dehalogenase-like hydrolase n=1 Tax=Vibrio sp. S9_S30 TaxID=2720226 RepID=UPI001680AEA1|nr:HAD family hydrolase [Vibrio sp. S9_S30]MBD1555652.1 haloacid dehalogenase-like hydrolase [Vibrio sp. S9_S30]